MFLNDNKFSKFLSECSTPVDVLYPTCVYLGVTTNSVGSFMSLDSLDYFDAVSGSIREKRRGGSQNSINMLDLKLIGEGSGTYIKDNIYVYRSYLGIYIGLDSPSCRDLNATIERVLNIFYPVYTSILKQVKNIDDRDLLTGLLSRKRFYADMIANLRTILATDLYMHVFYIDFNNFKVVNDVLGHKMGDRVLVSLSSEMLNVFIGYGNVYRLGGDEFVVVSLGLTDEIVNRLKKSIELVSEQAPCGLFVNLAVGYKKIESRDLIGLNLDTVDVDSVLEFAEDSMYHHKSGKKKQNICVECPKLIGKEFIA